MPIHPLSLGQTPTKDEQEPVLRACSEATKDPSKLLVTTPLLPKAPVLPWVIGRHAESYSQLPLLSEDLSLPQLSTPLCYSAEE